jgi:ribosomal protection tetracycline resistance protein
LWTVPGADRPVRGETPRRARFDGNPLDHDEYMRFLADRSLATGHVSAGTGEPRSNDASRATRR